MQTSQNKSPRISSRAFTLVELLVVIGIIALLISILLPALNRAREQSYAVKCQSNLRSIGQALFMYANSHKGYLPYGALYPSASTPLPPASSGVIYNGESADWSTLLLYQLQNKRGMGYNSQETVGTSNEGPRALFICPSVTIDSQVKGFRNHYSAHPRIFPNLRTVERYKTTGATSAKPGVKNRKLSSIKRSPEMVGLFDGVLTPNSAQAGGWTTHVTAEQIDNQGMVNPPYLVDDWQMAATSPRAVNAGTPVDLGLPGTGWTVKDINVDTDAYWGNFRFRHNKNTSINCLMMDGHVQSFKFNGNTGVTDMVKRNIYVNP